MYDAVLVMLFAPLAGAAFHALAGRFVPRWLVELAAMVVVLAAGAAAVTALAAGWEHAARIDLATWFAVPGFSVSASVLADRLALCMAVMVCAVSLVIHVYSVSFMRRDPGYVRYFCYLNLFVLFMLVIVLADDLVFLFLGWEGVGFCSYALIGFWYGDQARTLAGGKAFTLTRIGDVAFLAAIGLVVAWAGSASISHLDQAAAGMGAGAATLLGLLLLWAAVGKSAQLPLLVWLPDAMAGPSPVSALIHAATMVTAGVYLLMRLYPLLAASPEALFAVAAVGAVTALFAACAALAQRDIKRVLAWSTISQVGYMFLGIGAGDVAGAMFHLLSHAFFKSLLFMAAGCVIVHLREEHDIHRMGERVRRELPQVFWLFLAGCLALAGIPPASGYFSKGRVLLAALDHGGAGYTALWLLATAAALLTSLYTFRLLFLVFYGRPCEDREEGDGPDPECPPNEDERPSGRSRGRRLACDLVDLFLALLTLRFITGALSGRKGGDGRDMARMQHVLWPLALLSLGAGVLNLPGDLAASDWLARFLASTPGVIVHPSGASEAMVEGLDTVLGMTGLVAAWLIWGPGLKLGPRKPVVPGRGLGGALMAGFGLDRLYAVAVAAPYRALAALLWRGVDERGVDGAARGMARLAGLASRGTRLANTGRLSTYLLLFFVGATVVLAVVAGRLLW